LVNVIHQFEHFSGREEGGRREGGREEGGERRREEREEEGGRSHLTNFRYKSDK
jgi:hypothetical protein